MLSHHGFKKGHMIRFKTGRMIASKGYILIYSPYHPNRNSKKYVYEHRLVMEKHLGRYIKKGEIVHHINENIQDNRLENLMLFPNDTAHKLFHQKDKYLRNNFSYKFSDKEIKIIREEYIPRKNSLRKLAKKYGVSPNTINNIINNHGRKING